MLKKSASGVLVARRFQRTPLYVSASSLPVALLGLALPKQDFSFAQASGPF
ncbi:MAG: hypothetical protein IH977_09205 [Nitrospinae bacterium]|nr:hypothetical protein [Nitrospinota bacterium]